MTAYLYMYIRTYVIISEFVVCTHFFNVCACMYVIIAGGRPTLAFTCDRTKRL